MIYRDSTLGPCHRCEGPSQAECPCCRRPICARHGAGAPMCTHCDEALYRYLHDDSKPGLHVLTPLLTVIVLAVSAAVVASAVPALAAVLVVALLLVYPAWVVVRRRRRLARFFVIMRERGEIAAPPRDVSTEEEAMSAYLRSRALERGDVDR